MTSYKPKEQLEVFGSFGGTFNNLYFHQFVFFFPTVFVI